MRRSELCRRAMAEIGLDDDGVRNDLRRRALGEDAAFGEDKHMFPPVSHCGAKPPRAVLFFKVLELRFTILRTLDKLATTKAEPI